MSGLIAKKIGMVAVHNAKGKSLPCTILAAGPCLVVQMKTEEKDGYKSVQLGYQNRKKHKTKKPLQGHFAKAGVAPLQKLAEFTDFQLINKDKKISRGAEIVLKDVFLEGDYVHVAGISKGKGFQGVVKRHNFSGVGERSHGQGDRERAPGSIGACSTPSRVFKGMRMAGRMGGGKTTIQNLEVVKILPEQHIMLVKGSVPGPKNSFVKITK